MVLNLNELSTMDAVAQAELVRSREVTPVELVDAAIARIEKVNPTINAVIHKHFERARAQAAGKLPEGPFRGVPFLLKDLAGGNLKGDPNNWGTRFLRDANYRAPSTSHLVEKFLKAGLVIVGRTNVPELGAWATTEPEAYGPTRNPWDITRSSGGSSGGSAAAVASHMVSFAHASDGGGSIRIPASESGLVGLKPTRGRISLGPDVGEVWEGLAIEFAVTRTIRDAAALLDAVAGSMPGDPYAAVPPSRPYRQEVGAPCGQLRVGILSSSSTVKIHPDCAKAVDSAGRLLESLGHHIELSHPAALDGPELGVGLGPVIATSQARLIDQFSAAIGRSVRAEDMNRDNWALTEMGWKVTGTEYLASVEVLNRYTRNMAAWWTGGFDVLLTPTIPEPPPPIGELVPDAQEPFKGFQRSGALVPLTVPFNVTGQPAISLPLHWTDQGLPIGVQLVATFGHEDLLIRLASQIEQAQPWFDRTPPVHA
ncbi:MAG TPA: amidase family protein [Candidatus Binataceae bacterium]|nr:amidase family protein [Candidatus Binataceae bacterium]